PHLAGPELELLPQLKAVFRALAQQGQQRVPNAHQHLPGRYTRYDTGYSSDVQRADNGRPAPVRRPDRASGLTEQQPPQSLLHRQAGIAYVRGSPPPDDG